jgi:hypothetical protein
MIGLNVRIDQASVRESATSTIRPTLDAANGRIHAGTCYGYIGSQNRPEKPPPAVWRLRT